LSLRSQLAAQRLQLLLRSGDPLAVLRDIIRNSSATHLFFNASGEPDEERADQAIRQELGSALDVRRFSGNTLFEPGAVRSGGGTPFRVFTPFWRACLQRPEPAPPEPMPGRLMAFRDDIGTENLDDWRLLPISPDWAGGLRAHWRPGELAATKALEQFIDSGVATYVSDRDRPGVAGTSRLSPHLRFGEISSRQVWHAVRSRAAGDSRLAIGSDAFLRQLGWREFSRYVLTSAAQRAESSPLDGATQFPWREDRASFRAWTRGETGYPLVDAGMRELWTTGWMHNRVRMIAASFLVKHLLLDWRLGEAWFWDTLVDADLGNNMLNWRSVAAVGADAAPWFRIFNPSLQGRRFDPQGSYVRRWLPEIAGLPERFIHEPWKAPAGVQRAAGARIGRDYPLPIVEHGVARKRALLARPRAGIPAAAYAR
jgi:deoxyribodipyrimidine photo-lyase